MLQQWTSFFILLFLWFSICCHMQRYECECVCVSVCLCESALDREAQMVLAANAENNNKEHKSNRREAWEQLYPPVPTLALLYSQTLALSQLAGLFFPSLLPLINCSLLLSLSLSRTTLCVRERIVVLCLFGWWGVGSEVVAVIVVAIWSRRQNYAQRCHLVVTM